MEFIIILGTRLTFACASPSDQLVGERQSLCGEQGIWEPPVPYCQSLSIRSCPPTGPPENGYMELSNGIYRCEYQSRLIKNIIFVDGHPWQTYYSFFNSNSTDSIAKVATNFWEVQ